MKLVVLTKGIIIKHRLHLTTKQTIKSILSFALRIFELTTQSPQNFLVPSCFFFQSIRMKFKRNQSNFSSISIMRISSSKNNQIGKLLTLVGFRPFTLREKCLDNLIAQFSSVNLFSNRTRFLDKVNCLFSIYTYFSI